MSISRTPLEGCNLNVKSTIRSSELWTLYKGQMRTGGPDAGLPTGLRFKVFTIQSYCQLKRSSPTTEGLSSGLLSPVHSAAWSDGASWHLHFLPCHSSPLLLYNSTPGFLFTLQLAYQGPLTCGCPQLSHSLGTLNSGTHTEVKWQLSGVSFPLPQCGFQGQMSGGQVWQQVSSFTGWAISLSLQCPYLISHTVCYITKTKTDG